MIPDEERDDIDIPVTFDYHGGRASNRFVNTIVSLIIVAIGLLITVLVPFKLQVSILLKLLIPVIYWVLTFVLVPKVFWNEKLYKTALDKLEKCDYEPEISEFWGIYHIDNDYPYTVHFSNGLDVIFVLLEKDVITGKPENYEHLHQEAIADAYNMAGTTSIDMINIDYMDNVGNDNRFDALYESTDEMTNPDLKDAMIAIYDYTREDMRNYYASYDVYAFMTRTRKDLLWYNTQQIIDYMLVGSNFVGYSVMNTQAIKSCCIALMNLYDFSIKDACKQGITNNAVKIFTPIEINRNGVVEKINKTRQEIEDEVKLQDKKVKGKKKKKKDDIDLGEL